MTRVNIYSYPGDEDSLGSVQLAGWFDAEKAEMWSDADYNGNGSGGTGRGQAVYRTSAGRWVLSHWSRWDGETSRFEYVEPEQARDWLLRNHEDDAAARYFGEIADEEDRRPGRPAIGGYVHLPLGDLVGPLDAYAAGEGLSRAEAVRRLLGEALAAARPYTVTSIDISTRLRSIDSRHPTLGAAVEALREAEATDYGLQNHGLPSCHPRVEYNGQPVDTEAVTCG